MNITIAQEKIIAEFITGETVDAREETMHNGRVCSDIWIRGLNHPSAYRWNPDINGYEREQAQALQVIIAALNLDATAELSKRGGGNWQFINQDPECEFVKIGGAFAGDILTTCKLAILQHSGGGGMKLCKEETKLLPKGWEMWSCGSGKSIKYQAMRTGAQPESKDAWTPLLPNVQDAINKAWELSK